MISLHKVDGGYLLVRPTSTSGTTWSSSAPRERVGSSSETAANPRAAREWTPGWP